MGMPVRNTSALAVISLVTGILGWSLLPVLGCVVAIVTGHLARGEIRRRADQLDGDGLARAGLILGYVGVGLALFTVVAFLLFFGGLAWLAHLNG